MSFIIELKKERQSLQKRLEAIDLLLESYGETFKASEEIVEKVIMEDYDLIKQLKKSSTPKKFLLILNDCQRFMKIREIAKIISVQIGGSEDDWTMKLSRTTGKLKENGEISSYRVGSSNTGYYWGSPKWLEENGNIKKGYDYIDDSKDPLQSSLL